MMKFNYTNSAMMNNIIFGNVMSSKTHLNTGFRFLPINNHNTVARMKMYFWSENSIIIHIIQNFAHLHIC